MGSVGIASRKTGVLPVLEPDDDFGAFLASHPQVELVPAASYVLPAPVEVPDNCVIIGNGARITVTGTTAALRITGRRDVTIRDVRFVGQPADPLGADPVFEHVAVRITRSTNVRVVDCDFANWRGAGVVSTGSVADDYFGYRVKLRGNSFIRCYFGVSVADRSEYSVMSGNSFTYCRLAIWNSSGNWEINDNDIIGCYGAYYSFNRTSPYGVASSDNWGHGSFAGNTANHSNGGAKALWSTGTSFPIGGVPTDPGHGIVVSGVLPPTFTGNTLWYTDLTAKDLADTRWLITGCTLSNLTVSATGAVPVQLVGVQSNVAPILSGSVTDLLASLY
ncbi:right-handed parallel beta-helix repeat-containing protein [Kribbella sp. NPDC059898]|uniref:right-handed parallel beta-helix repeat-containing protein n=1 Tax=Kribbella sp. NPDC059898 TaxID=3346995 RepID=UPI00364B4DF5